MGKLSEFLTSRRSGNGENEVVEIKPAFDYTRDPRQFSVDYGELVLKAGDLGRSPTLAEILAYRRIRGVRRSPA